MPSFTKPASLTQRHTHYCPGCGHGIAHRLVAEAIDSLGIRERTIGIAPVGCAVVAYYYLDVDMVEVAHGRAPAVATGIKRYRPDCVVFTYQGDGDLAAIGTNEILHAANRGESLTVIFINNAVYGMTGGQMAPTTLLGQRTATTPGGREPGAHGHPLKVAELIAGLPGVAYVERVALSSPGAVRRAGAAIKRAFAYQLEGAGLSLVECLSMCPTYWGMKPAEACRWIDEVMTRHYPLGVLKEPKRERALA